jgi:hypothetical protein
MTIELKAALLLTAIIFIALFGFGFMALFA